MTKLTTEKITVQVTSFYQPEYSEPESDKYIFAYQIDILNESDVPVQLLNRYWRIVEGDGMAHEVEGEGVIGKQPILEPGEQHSYMSWVQIRTPIGGQHGHYEFRRYWQVDPAQEERFIVEVPAFTHFLPELAN